MHTVSDPRWDRERRHFDTVYLEESRTESLLISDFDFERHKDPSATTAYSREYFYHLLALSPGMEALEIACGNGLDSCLCAHYGASVYAYDVSPQAIALARQRAELHDLEHRVHLEVASSLDEAFKGNDFDRVFGFAALHHLPLEDLGRKIYERLRPGGIAVFAEPVRNNRVLSFLRRLIPYRPVEPTEDEEPLNDRAIADLAVPFQRVVLRRFECIARVWPLVRHRSALVRGLFKVDAMLMRTPLLHSFASVVVFAMYRDSE